MIGIYVLHEAQMNSILFFVEKETPSCVMIFRIRFCDSTIWVRGVNCHFIIINRSWTKVTHTHTCTLQSIFLLAQTRDDFKHRVNKWNFFRVVTDSSMGETNKQSRKNIRVGQHKNAIFLSLQRQRQQQHQTSCHTIYHYNFPPGFLVATLRPRPTCQVGNSFFFPHIIVNPLQIQLKYMKESSRTAEKKLKLMHYDLHEWRNVRRITMNGGWQMPLEKTEKKYDKWVFD